jgi:hypothetical protein
MTKHFTTGKDDLTGNSSAYYKLPEDATDIQDLIEFRNMNFAQGNIIKAIYRIGEKPGVDAIYDLEKIIWFANREINRLNKNNIWIAPAAPALTKAEKNYKDIIEKEKTLVSNIMKNINISQPVGTEIVYTTGEKAGQTVDPNDFIESEHQLFNIVEHDSSHDNIINSIRAKAQENFTKKVDTQPNLVDKLADTFYNESSIDDEFIVFAAPQATANPTWDIPVGWLEVSEEPIPVVNTEVVANSEITFNKVEAATTRKATKKNKSKGK